MKAPEELEFFFHEIYTCPVVLRRAKGADPS